MRGVRASIRGGCRVNRDRIGVVGGGADVGDQYVSVCGTAGWVVNPENKITLEVISFVVREGWCGWLG